MLFSNLSTNATDLLRATYLPELFNIKVLELIISLDQDAFTFIFSRLKQLTQCPFCSQSGTPEV